MRTHVKRRAAHHGLRGGRVLLLRQEARGGSLHVAARGPEGFERRLDVEAAHLAERGRLLGPAGGAKEAMRI
jgi:hypothetical protein